MGLSCMEWVILVQSDLMGFSVVILSTAMSPALIVIIIRHWDNIESSIQYIRSFILLVSLSPLFTMLTPKLLITRSPPLAKLIGSNKLLSIFFL